MADLLKKFGKGILYILIFPGFVIFLAGCSLVSLVGFIILLFKSTFLFFTGRSLYEDLPEDKKAKEILDARAGQPQPQAQPYVQPIVQNIVQNPNVIITQNPFAAQNLNNNAMNNQQMVSQPQFVETKSQIVIAEPSPNLIQQQNENLEQSMNIDSNQQSINNNQDSEEEIGQYKTESAILNEDEISNSENNGVNIDF